MLDKRLESMRWELKNMAEKEAIKLWRLARKAERHNVSNELIYKIREEATCMYITMTTYPDRLLERDFEYKFKFAFKY